VVCERFLTVQTSKQCGKQLAVSRGPWRRGGEGGEAPMVQPAQWLIRHWLYVIFLNRYDDDDEDDDDGSV